MAGSSRYTQVLAMCASCKETRILKYNRSCWYAWWLQDMPFPWQCIHTVQNSLYVQLKWYIRMCADKLWTDLRERLCATAVMKFNHILWVDKSSHWAVYWRPCFWTGSLRYSNHWNFLANQSSGRILCRHQKMIDHIKRTKVIWPDHWGSMSQKECNPWPHQHSHGPN